VADPLKSPTLNFHKTFLGLLFWTFKFDLTTFPSKNHENCRKIHKKSINRCKDEMINR
jgi:hypothetical protein